MARKTRRKRERKKKKKERRERMEKATPKASSQLMASPYAPSYQKTEDIKISPKRASLNTFVYGTMILSGLFGGGIYIINPSKYADLGLSSNDWFVVGIGVGALISLGLGFLTYKKFEEE